MSGEPEKNDVSSEDTNKAPGGNRCCLCGTGLVERSRDPLWRVLGLALVYLAALLLVVALPGVGWGIVAAAVILSVCGLALARNTKTLWCPGCWFETDKAQNAGQPERKTP